MMNDIERAERDAGVRVTLFFLMAAALIASTLLAFGHPESRQYGRLAVWALTAILMALNLTPLILRRSPAVRALLNDESARQHRQAGLVAGFWAAIASASAMGIVSAVTEVAAVDVARIVITAALSAALISIAVLERRAAA